MDVDIVKSEFVTFENAKGSGTLTGETEPITFGSHGPKEAVNGVGGNRPADNFPKDAVDDWPVSEKIHSFYFVKYRLYDDPKLKAKLDSADKELQKRTLARSQIIEKLKEKRAERAQLFLQMKPLNDENKQYWSVVDEKKKEMEPLQQALGKFRNNNANRGEKGVAIHSSEEDLNNHIKSLHYRIQHESIPLTEEKQILREIKQLEGTREKVVANAAVRAKIEESLGQKEALQDQVKLIGVGLDGVRKEQQVIKAKLKQLGDEKVAIEKEIEDLEAELTAATEKREKAYEALQELKKQREEGNASYYQNRRLLNEAKRLATDKNIDALQDLGNSEVEKFMAMWNKSKPFRDDYERRILLALDIRQLSRDGRMKNPDEKPSVLPEPSTSPQTPELVVKPKPKQPKEDTSKNASLDPAIDSSIEEKIRKPERPKEEPKVDDAKLKEMRREEEIAKAKLALERKKKLALKAAAKAALKAQKEAEKKLKEREKKLRKKASASGQVIEPKEQPTEAVAEVAKPEKIEQTIEEPIITKPKDRKNNPIRNRTRSKVPDSLSKNRLNRKKSTNYWVWAAALSVVMAFVIGYNYLL